jgi:glycosyltransferase involved in cell wall biosynthesis
MTSSLRVVGLTAYPQVVASARVRVANYVPFLHEDGIDLAFCPKLTPRDYGLLASSVSPARKAATLAASTVRAARNHLPQHDLVLVHRLVCLTPLPGRDPPRRLDVYDLDDALFLGSHAEVNRRFRWVKQEARRSIACMRRARLVIAGNLALATRAREYAAQVEIIPSVVDPDRQPVRQHAQVEVVRIGWVGSPTTSAYLTPLLPVLASLNRSRPVAKLIVVGADTGIREPWIEHHPWALEQEAQMLASFDIGVMPQPDTDWARGKCGYKTLQYFCAGVPAVVSPVGVATKLVAEGRGVAATTPSEWQAALSRLSVCWDERVERGAKARAFVEREYSYQRWAPELAGLLRSLAS